MIKQILRWAERRFRPADYCEQEALVSLGLDALLLGGYDHAFIAVCREIHAGSRQELYGYHFARMVQAGMVQESRMVDLLTNIAWPGSLPWFRVVLHGTVTTG